MSPLQRLARPGYGAGSPRPYVGGHPLRVRLSAVPYARRNGRASASLTARGGGLPIGVSNPSCYLLKSMGFCLTLTVKTPISPQEEPAHGRHNYRDVLSV